MLMLLWVICVRGKENEPDSDTLVLFLTQIKQLTVDDRV